MIKTGLFLWHDDVRRPPRGFDYWAQTNEQALIYLREKKTCNEKVQFASLDHDLGATLADPTGGPDGDEIYLQGSSPDGDGRDLVDEMVRLDLVPPMVRIHSWNPPCAKEMLRRLIDNGKRAYYEPFNLKWYAE